MNRILVIYSARIPSVELFLRTFLEFGRRCKTDIKEMPVMSVRKQDIEWSDILLAIRPFEISAYGIVMSAFKSGRKIFVYLDDDLLHLPDIYSSNLRRLFARTTHNSNCTYLERILNICDVLWGSSPYLIEQYKPLVLRGRCECTDICMVTSATHTEKHNDGKIKIVYAGSGNHYVQLNRYIIPALNRLASNYDLSLTCIGMRSEYIDDCKVDFHVFPWMNNLEEYNSFMRDQQFDIGVAPVEQDVFHRCKYFNKYIEYASLGVIGIYTDDYPYKSVVKNEINGLLSENTIDSWTFNIKYAIDNPDKCKEMIDNSSSDLLSRFSMNSQVEQIELRLPELLLENNSIKEQVRFAPHYILNKARKTLNCLVYKYENIKR